jgi:hypothetical protein
MSVSSGHHIAGLQKDKGNAAGTTYPISPVAGIVAVGLAHVVFHGRVGESSWRHTLYSQQYRSGAKQTASLKAGQVESACGGRDRCGAVRYRSRRLQAEKTERQPARFPREIKVDAFGLAGTETTQGRAAGDGMGRPRCMVFFVVVVGVAFGGGKGNATLCLTGPACCAPREAEPQFSTCGTPPCHSRLRVTFQDVPSDGTNILHF